MPLAEDIRKFIAENGFWLAVFAVAYIAMMKFMHPGWKIFGF